MTKPFEIIGMQKTAENGSFEVIGWTGLDKIAYYPIRVHSDKLLDHDSVRGAFYVPGNAEFIEMEQEKVSSLSDQIRDKQPAENNVFKDSVGLYSFSGPEFEKYGESNSVRDLSKTDAIWTAVHCNCPESVVAEISKLANCSTVHIKEPIKSPKSVKDIKRDLLEKVGEFNEKVSIIMPNLIKEAAVVDDSATVDALLSLGMVNKGNIMEFVNMVPQYEMVLSELAKMLIISRLGKSQVPEDAIQRAMSGLSEVILALKQVGTIVADQ